MWGNCAEAAESARLAEIPVDGFERESKDQVTDVIASTSSPRFALLHPVNQIDYPTSIWAGFRLGACVTAANPAYNSEELKTQLEIGECRASDTVSSVGPLS